MYDELLTRLRATGVAFAEMGWRPAPATGCYGVISQEPGGDAVYGDNGTEDRARAYSIDLFARSKGKTEAALIESELDGMDGCAWYLTSVQYEEDTGITHWEWVAETEGA